MLEQISKMLIEILNFGRNLIDDGQNLEDFSDNLMIRSAVINFDCPCYHYSAFIHIDPFPSTGS